MKTDNNRKYLLIFSGLLLGFQYLGVVIDTNIPYTQIKISSQANISIILTILIVFFGGQFTFYWLNLKKAEKSVFEFITAIPIAVIAIAPVIYNYLSKYGIDWKVIISTILIMLFGSLLAIAVDFIISIIFSLRSPEEMEKMGLGKIPSASKAFIRSLFLLIPLSVTTIFLLVRYEYLLPSPINNYWVIIFLTPAILLNFENFINIFLCVGPPKVRKKALERLRVFRRAMDLHEMHYQYIGVEKPKPIQLPPICAFAKEGLLDEVQNLLSTGVDPNTQDGRGWCPLMWATAEGHQEIVELLLEHGADPNIVNYLGRSAIMYASNYGFHEIAKVLLERGAIPNPSREFTDHPPLSAAAYKGHLEVVKLLVEHGANVKHKGKDNKTALDISMEAGHGEVAKYLRNKVLELDDTPPEDKTNLIKNIEWVGKTKKQNNIKKLVLPAGTVFNLDEDLLQQFLENKEINKKEPDSIIASMILNNEEHHFSFSDFEMLVAGLSESERKQLASNEKRARIELIAEMYLQRFR